MEQLPYNIRKDSYFNEDTYPFKYPREQIPLRGVKTPTKKRAKEEKNDTYDDKP